MWKKPDYTCETPAFLCERMKQFVTVEDGQLVRRRIWDSKAIVDETFCDGTRLGCAIEEIAASPSGSWLVTRRSSGQGEWGYDVFRTSPLAREAGTPEEYGYMFGLPTFTADETSLVGAFGERWLGGWWVPDNEIRGPARGGLISFGFLFVHHLPGHQVERHELKINLPKGWLPDDTEDAIWQGANEIIPEIDRIRLIIYGGVNFEITGPIPPAILLPTPHTSGRRLL